MSAIRFAAAVAAGLTFTCAVVDTAVAQTPTAATPDVAVPTMNCDNPGTAPLDRAGAAMTRFIKRVEDYKVCVNAYTAAQSAKANDYAAMSRAYGDAANKAIDGYNDYINALNASQKSDKPGAERTQSTGK